MIRAVFLILTVLFNWTGAEACVGKLLTVGVIDSPGGQVLGELLSNMINERTGTSVKIKSFRNAEELYRAVKMKEVDILVENTTSAMRFLNRPAQGDPKKNYELLKDIYEKEKGLIWLKPFGFLNGNEGSPSYTGAVLRADICGNFPALPRLINKLGGAITDESYTKMMKSVESGQSPKKTARDFLKSKKLI